MELEHRFFPSSLSSSLSPAFHHSRLTCPAKAFGDGEVGPQD